MVWFSTEFWYGFQPVYTYEKHIVDTETGMPLKGGCKSRKKAMAGAFKVYGSYLTTGKDIPYPDKAIDFVLGLQLPDGYFGEGDTPEPMTINWDSMWDLRVLSNAVEGTYRLKDIAEAGNRQAEFLLKRHRKKDGGFSFYPDRCLTIHNSIRISDKHVVSDSLGTSMCILCLMYADEWNSMV